MPLYEYQCQKCGHRFELIRRFSDPDVEACPLCKGPVDKLLSSPAIQFKGTGWYITDYARCGTTEAGEPAPSTTKPAEGGTPGADAGSSASSSASSDSPASSSSDSSSKDS